MLKDDVIGILGRILDPEEFDPRFKNPDRVSDAPLATPVVQGRETIPMKPLSLSELEGFPYLTTMSDRTAAGGQLVGVGDKSLAYPVNLTGGQDFMRDFTENPNLWASGEGVVPKMVQAARELETEYGKQPVLMPWTMSPTGSDFAGMTGKTMFSYASENMPKTFKNEVDGYMKLHVPNWKGIDNPESGAQFDALPDKSRKIVQRDMDTKFRNVGGITLPQTRVAIADQSQLSQPVMGFKNVGLIDTSVDALAGAGNPTYPSALAGKYMGTLDTDVTAIDLNPNRYARARRADGSFVEDPQGKDFLSTKTAPRRSMEVNYYGGLIDEPLLRSLEDRGFNVSKKQGGFANLGLLPVLAGAGLTAINFLNPEEAESAIIPKLAQTTQRANTVPTAKAADKYLTDQGATGKSLDYGAGFGLNAKSIGFDDTFEPFADDTFKPTYSSAADIPENTYGKVISTNVLNVLPPDARTAAVQNIGSILEPNGMAVIQTRSASAVNELKKSKTAIPQDEPASFLTSKGSYQKGFTRDELQNEVQGILGDNFEVTKIPSKDIPNGSAISVKKLRGVALPTAVAATGLLGGQEEAEAAGLVAAVPSIARKMLDDPNAPKKNTPQGWANYLKNNGAKPNEIEKYNLDLIDSKRPLDKEEVSQYLLDNEYKFDRSLYTEQPNQTDVDLMREQYKDYFDERMSTYGATTADVNEEIGGLLDEKQPNFRTDRSDGDITNYRNQVLTDPSGEQIDQYISMNTQRSTQLSGELIELNNAIDNESFILDNVDGNLVKVPMEEMIARRTKLQTDKARLELLRNQAENRLFVESSHFTDPNAIGHVRTTDRVNTFDPRTGKKTEYRLMEEVQSDWVQRAENPDYGVKDVEAMDNLYDAMYESKVNQYKAMANASPDEKEGIFNAYLAEQADISRRLDSMNRSDEGLALVPQPPVAKPHIPLVNQTIIDAVDDNMDGVGIVTGDTQLAAKDQFQFINDISWKTVKSDGDAAEILFDFSGITNRQGDVGTVHQQLSMDIEKDMEAFRTMMPKGAADKIIDEVKAAVAKGDDSGVMSNFNTQVEGKKLRPYYNKTLRKHLEQIGKQYGVKVERRNNTDEYSIDDLDDGYYAVVRDGDVLEEFDDIDEAKQYLATQQMGADDHFYLPFTDEMKADVKKNGLKMFSTIGLTPVAIDAMRSNVNAEDERMRVVYDDTDTQREENRAAIEDMLARDAKTRKREELGDTLTGLLDAPRTALSLAGDAVTGLVSDAATIPSLFVSAYEKATPTEADAGMGQRYGDKMKQLAELGMSLSPMGLMNFGKGDTRKEELIKGQIGENVTSAVQAAAPYLRDAYTHEGLLGAPSIQDMVQATQQGYQSLPEGYLKDNALPAAGLSALGVLGMYDVLGLRRKAAQAAQQNMMPQGLLN
jgi:hypothetical protein